MKVLDYDFYLPESAIAQSPATQRDHSKLLVVHREDLTIEERYFYDIVNYFKSGDVLVMNNTRVIPARLMGQKAHTGAVIEVFLLKKLSSCEWECLLKPAKRVKIGQRIDFGSDMSATLEEIYDNGNRRLKFHFEGVFEEKLAMLGEMPLPPYIKEKLREKDRYQTVYAKSGESVAAPTAGLHFTSETLKILEEKGVELLEVNLEVGIGTFRPVQSENILEHDMHAERFSISENVAQKINQAKKEKRRIIAVGTTTVRTLESSVNQLGEVVGQNGETAIFIYPGYQFKVIDGLITNFHLPKSTLLMLVSALTTRERMLEIYQYAVEHEYRFFSFGDAMFIK